MDSVKKKIRAFFGRITEESVHRAVCLTVIVACLMFVVINNTTVLSLAADDEDQVSDYSFYKLSSIASSAFSSALVDDADGPETALETYFGSLNPNTGGGVIAFPDDSDRGIFGMFVNFISSSSATKSYSSFGDSSVYADDDVYFDDSNPFGAYITLGAALSDLGLDQTGSAAETITFFSIRNMIGSLVLIAYMGAQSIAVIFEFCISVLQALNPFRFFKSVTTPSAPGVATNSWTSKLTNIGSGTGPLNGAFDDVIDGVATFIATFYEYLYVAGIVILAIFFAYTLVSFFNPKMAKSRNTLLKNYIVRGLFIIGGLALLGGTYTTMLNWVSDSMSGSNSAASKVVASTFVDFEGWVYKGMPTDNLSLPYEICDGQISAGDNVNVQSICYQMNKEVCGNLPATTASNWADMSATIDTIQNGTTSSVASTLDSDDFTWVLGLLNRYIDGNKVTSADYESEWKGKYWSDGDADEMAALAEFIEYSSSVSEITTSNDLSTNRYSDATLEIDGYDVANPFGSSETDGPSIDVSSGYNGRYFDSTVTGTLGEVTLSPMSIYNYLNTRFDSSSMVLYSNHKSISQFTRESHYAVNLVGSGINSVIILGTCLSLLVTYMVLGFVYGFGMIINNIKRGMRMIIAVPGAMLGSLHSIAKVVSYVVLMIVEILVHIFMYCLTTEMLYALATSFTQVMQDTMDTLLGQTVAAMLSPIIGIVIIVFLWTFTIKCIQLKKPIIAMFEEMADNVVQKFIVGSTAAERRVMAQQAGGGAAASAGGAAAGAAAGKKGAKGVTMGDFGKATALNAVTGGVGGNLYLHNKNAKAKMEAKKAKGQAEAQLLMSQMGIGGGTSSALEEERNLDQVAAAKRENKKTAAKETAAGAARATMGAVEVAAGAYTGNAALAAKGAKDLAQGSMDMNNASINKDNNDAAAMAQGAQANGSALVSAKGGDKGLTAQKNNTSVEKFDVGKEAIATAGAVVGGNLGSAAGNGSISMADAKSLAGAAKAVKSGDYAGAAKSALEVAGKNGSTPQAITANGAGTTTVTTEETIEELTKSNFKSSSQKSEVGGKKLERNDGDLVGGTSQRQIESSEDVTVKAGTNVQVDAGEAGTVTEVGSANVQVPQQRESSKSFEATENATVNKKVLVGSNTTFEQVGGNDNGTPVFSKNQSTVVGAQEEHTVNRQVSYRENVIDNGPTGSDNHPRNLNTSGNYTTSEVHDEHTEQRRVTRKTVTTQTVQNVGGGQVQSGSGMAPQHTSETVDNQHTTYVRQYDDVQVQKSGTSGGGKNLGGTMGNFAAQNTQQDVVQTNTVNVRQDEHVNYQQGSRTQSGYRNNRSNGDFNDSFDSRQVTDTINVHQNERINYQKGGSQVTGKMNNGFGAQIAGEHRSETVVDTVDVERRTEYKESRKDAPRKAKPGSTDDTI